MKVFLVKHSDSIRQTNKILQQIITIFLTNSDWCVDGVKWATT